PTLINNTLINNGINGLTLSGGELTSDTIWNVTDTAYFLRDPITVGLGKTLTINSGLVLKFNLGNSLFVNGALRVLGTANAPVSFTSTRDDLLKGDTNGDGSGTSPARGDWWQIEFGDNSNDAASLIEGAVIRYGGGTQCCYAYYGAITLNSASPAIRDTTIRD